jgi:hypothetical protein
MSMLTQTFYKDFSIHCFNQRVEERRRLFHHNFFLRNIDSGCAASLRLRGYRLSGVFEELPGNVESPWIAFFGQPYFSVFHFN